VKEAAKQVGEAGKEIAKETGKELGITTEEKKVEEEQAQEPELSLEELFIKKYGDSPRPENFEEIKKLLFTFIPDWKLKVEVVESSGVGSFKEPPLLLDEDLAMKKGIEIIFKDLPPYKFPFKMNPLFPLKMNPPKTLTILVKLDI